MTDTRKEFEQFVLDNMRTDAPNFINERMFAEKSWQACQQLNDKRIADLLAVIESKNRVLQYVLECATYYKWHESYNGRDSVKQSLAINPEDVELEEVGTVCFEDTLVGVDLTNPTVKHGDTVYTIKTKE